MNEELTLEESIKIVIELAEQSMLTEEQAKNNPELQEEREKQLQSIANIEYNF